MSIKGDKTIDGIDISTLSLHSHMKVIRICDDCGSEDEVVIRDVYKRRIRSKNKDNKDYCWRCARKRAGFLRRKGKLLLADGYFREYKGDKRVFLHRLIMEKSIGRDLLDNEIVHHIDGDKKNNSISNLVIAENESDHQKIHGSLQRQAFKLVQSGLIKFDKTSHMYFLDNNLTSDRIPISLGFDEVAILQNKNICRSRLDVDISSEVFRGISLAVPIMASNMSAVVDAEFCIQLYKLGALGVMHRALPDERLVSSVKQIAAQCSIVCASVGLGDNQFDLARKLFDAGANVIFIDVAHGYSDFVIEMGRKLKKEFSGVKVVLGNTINTDMMFEVNDFADAVKVGIANGLACKTKNTAACNEKQFTSVSKFKDISVQLGLPIISDGSIREPADFTKAIAAGANSVMAGSIFARCSDSPAETILIDGIRKKIYAGMASREVQEQWRNGVKKGTCTEGIIKYLDVGESSDELIDRYIGALRSGITYAGAKDIKGFQQLAKFVRVK